MIIRQTICRSSRSLVLLFVLYSSFALGVMDEVPASSAVAGQELTNDELKKLYQSLSRPYFSMQYAHSLSTEFKNRPVLPVLLDIVKSEEVERFRRINAMYFLAALGDSDDAEANKAVNSVFREIIQGLYSNGSFPPTISRERWDFLYNAMVCLGYVADAESLNLLVSMVSTSFWENKGGTPNVVDKNEGEAFSSSSTMDTMRLIALQGIAMSGEDWAVEMFQTGQDVPDDFNGDIEWLHSLAVRRKEGTFYQPRVTTKPGYFKGIWLLFAVVCAVAFWHVYFRARQSRAESDPRGARE